jgi:hypothetical protein
MNLQTINNINAYFTRIKPVNILMEAVVLRSPSPPFLRVLSSKTPKINHFLGGRTSDRILLKKDTEEGCYTLPYPYSPLFVSI